MITVIIIILAVLFTALAWRDFKFALMLLLALLPTYLLRFSVGPLPSTLLEVFILTLGGVWLLKYRQVVKIPPALVALLGVATLAIVFSPDKLAALGLWRAYFLEPLLVFVMIRSTFTESRDWQRALQGMGLSVIIISLFAMVQFVTGKGIPVPWDIERRVTSVFEYPNALGLFVAPVMAALAMARPRGWMVAFACGAVAIVLAETEAAYVAIPAALLVGVLATPTVSLSVKRGASVLALVALVLALVLPFTREKLFLHDTSGLVRRAQWSEAMTLLKAQPLQGAGLAGYPTEIAPYHDGTLYEIFQYPHNVGLNIWVELGILGLVVAIWLAIVVARQAWQHRYDPLVVAGAVGLLTMVIHGLVDVPFFKNDLAVLTVFFLAMTLAASTRFERG